MRLVKNCFTDSVMFAISKPPLNAPLATKIIIKTTTAMINARKNPQKYILAKLLLLMLLPLSAKISRQS